MKSLTLTRTYFRTSVFLLFVLAYLVNVHQLHAQNTPSNVVSYTLINSNTDTDIGILNDGDTLYLNNLPTAKLNIRANTSPGTVDKVFFDYNGVQNYRSEGAAPYALFGDKSGDYNEWTPSPGTYTLNATSKLNGVKCTGHPISFHVVNGGKLDCNGDPNGSASIDDCGICSGGNTGISPNANKDTCGVCFGNNQSCNNATSPNPPGNSSGLVCGNFPGGRIAMASDGNNADADDHGSTAFSIAMLHYAGLLDKLVFIGHSSLYKSPCKNAYGNWCDLIDSASTGAMLRFGGDASIIYSFKEDYDDNNQLDESIAALTNAINASSPGDPLWIYCAGPMDVVYRAIDNASKSKRAYVKCISHSKWNQNSTYGGLSYDWADMKSSFTSDGVSFHEISDQNKSNGNYDFAQESDGASKWNWLAQSGDPVWTWLRNTNLDSWLSAKKNKVFDISDAGMMYWLISGGPQGGCENCGPIEVEQLFKNPCTTSGNACANNQAGTGNIVNPIDGATFSENSNISVSANIHDAENNTSEVRFFVDSDLKSTDKSKPYGSNLGKLDTGYRYLYAQIIDSCGATAYTDSVRIYVESVDCAGVQGGSAYMDNCGNCVGGTTGASANNSCADCAGVINGNAFIDSCGNCAGGNTGIQPNQSCTDCNGDINGNASIDNCGVCSGGNTGIAPNSSCGSSGCSGNEVDVLMLINASNTQDIAPMQNGDTIDLAIFPQISVRAEPCNEESVESVEFRLNGSLIRTENVEPYAVNGDKSGAYHSWPLTAGTYTLEATPYSSNRGRGTAGQSNTISFYVVNSNAQAAKATIASTSITEGQKPEPNQNLNSEALLANEELNSSNPMVVDAYPNPTQGVLRLEIKTESTAYTCEVFDAMGSRVQALQFVEHSFQIDLSSFKSGLYLIRIASDDHMKIIKVYKE